MRVVALVATSLSFVAMSAAQVTVMVGATAATAGGPLQFLPPNVTAANGTTVTFVWQGSPGNHTVTQSSLGSPCQPLAGGLDSGYIFIPANTTTDFPSWNVTITDDTTPIYFYCAQLLPVPHCSNGMVGAINAPTSGTGSFSTFQAAAIASNGTLPGAPIPNLVGVGASATVLPGPFSGNETGFALPTGPTATNAVPITGSSGATSSSTTSGASAASSSTGSASAPSPTGSPSSGELTSVSFLGVSLATLFSVLAIM